MKHMVGSVEFSRVLFNHATEEINRHLYVHTPSCTETLRASVVKGQTLVTQLVCNHTQGNGQPEVTHWWRAKKLRHV